ncbi:predicted protein [Nematostella vectensis]|uniref:C3H1-type domain-containing protein n=1 Tax=Nematostella vectensis TaxID=45351 RepID=A7SKJ1_NEMVE|nr:predicted protein [Nematostella vectensis]|eukprot:XP_001627830.1 predicted protein [Nematostella vectensis]
MVTQIVTGKYVDLRDLLPTNCSPATEAEPLLKLDGLLILTATQSRKPKQAIEDIVSWVEAFSIYMAVATHYHPQRFKNLHQYLLLIIRTYRQFSGRAWQNYDVAFRQQAAALRCEDWSAIDTQLFNFHTAGSAPLPLPQPRSRSTTNCISWNRGSCVAPNPSACHFTHSCLTYHRNHQVRHCPNRPTGLLSHRNRPRSPPPAAPKRFKRN